MKILHILSDGPSKLSSEIIGIHEKDNEVKVVDLSKKELSYEAVIEEIFSNDKVVSW